MKRLSDGTLVDDSMCGGNFGDLEHFASRLFSKMADMFDRQSERLENKFGSFMVEVESKMDKRINALSTRWEERQHGADLGGVLLASLSTTLSF